MRADAESDADQPKETLFESLAGICSVLVVGLFILTFLAQNFVIPSGSMENTLLVGDHLVVDRITLAPPAKWMPLVHYREPKRGDIVVFIKPVADLDEDGQPDYPFLVKRLVGVPGDRIHLHNGIVYSQRRGAESPQGRQATAGQIPLTGNFSTSFRLCRPILSPATSSPKPGPSIFQATLQNGDLVVPPGQYFMMGDNRHNSADSRFWGFVPRENIMGRPLFNYWSFKTPDEQEDKTGAADNLAWMGHVALHFFTDTRWSRTLHRVR